MYMQYAHVHVHVQVEDAFLNPSRHDWVSEPRTTVPSIEYNHVHVLTGSVEENWMGANSPAPWSIHIPGVLGRRKETKLRWHNQLIHCTCIIVKKKSKCILHHK